MDQNNVQCGVKFKIIQSVFRYNLCTLRGWCQLQLEGPFCVWSSFHWNFQLLSKQNLLQHPTPLSLVVVREATQRVGLHSQAIIEHAVQSTLPVTSSQVHQSILKTTLIVTTTSIWPWKSSGHTAITIKENVQVRKILFQVNTGAKHLTAAPYFWTSQHWSRQSGRCWRSAPAPAWSGWEALIFLPLIRWNRNFKIHWSRPELSSPTTNTFASFFLKPSAETNLSRNPMRRTILSKVWTPNYFL